MAIDRMTQIELKEHLSSPEAIPEKSFAILRELCVLVGSKSEDPDIQELVLRALEHRDRFGSKGSILDGLAREIGLFPYLSPDNLGVQDQVAYEFHRPLELEEDVVFHRPQARVYRELLDGRSVILSAPTSFGKSLIIDAIIASHRYHNLLIVVPTLALIDETRRRLSRFKDFYKIITHVFQRPAAANIYVLTQERVLELPEIPNIDFFVIDEFYKLSPLRSGEDDERALLLNQVLYKLTKTGKPFYMLGPGVAGISGEFRSRIESVYVHEPYQTVVSELHAIDPGRDEFQTLTALCRSLSDPTIIFTRSPDRAAKAAMALSESGLGTGILENAAEWIASHYHEDWHFTKAVRHGIGVHHGRIPRALGQFMVRAFNSDQIRYLVCTSTLIEGVNTKAKNVIIFDNEINKSTVDLFTFNNIRGRAGRMFKHFVGHVYLFHDPPQGALPLVDVPIFSQKDETPESLLLQIEDQDLTDTSRYRLRAIKEQEDLGIDTIRRNIGIDPFAQIELARELAESRNENLPYLSWRSQPTYDQLQKVCDLLWRHFDGWRLARGSVFSSKQLTLLLWKLKDRPSTRELIISQMQFRTEDSADAAVQRTLDFLRLWAEFHFPRLLRALDAIQREVFQRFNMQAGDYSSFATRVESLFLDPALVALDEYGIPLPLARKLEEVISPDGDLDEVLSRLRYMRIPQNLSPFERELVEDAQKFV